MSSVVETSLDLSHHRAQSRDSSTSLGMTEDKNASVNLFGTVLLERVLYSS
jgi:hypothetical protein